MASLEAEVFDVGGAGFADPLAVQPEQHRKRGMIAVVLLGGEQEPPAQPGVRRAGQIRIDDDA